MCNTSLKGTDNTHVFSTQIQEGICVWWQLHQPDGWILEHQVFGGCVVFRGEEVNTLQKAARPGKPILLHVVETLIWRTLWCFIPWLWWESHKSFVQAGGPFGWQQHELVLWPGGRFCSRQWPFWCYPCTEADTWTFQILKETTENQNFHLMYQVKSKEKPVIIVSQVCGQLLAYCGDLKFCTNIQKIIQIIIQTSLTAMKLTKLQL